MSLGRNFYVPELKLVWLFMGLPFLWGLFLSRNTAIIGDGERRTVQLSSQASSSNLSAKIKSYMA